MPRQTVVVLDFGGQYNQLIARRVRECGVYCELKPCTAPLSEIRALNPIGLIFTGGPASVYDPGAPEIDRAVFEWGIPVLGICYGAQFMAQTLGGEVKAAEEESAREFGRTMTYFEPECPLFNGLSRQDITWMSHGDFVEKIPDGFQIAAHSDSCPAAAIYDPERHFYGVQFHPEVSHTRHGTDMLKNFLHDVCGAACDWCMEDYKTAAVASLREKIGDGKVLLALSGGVDSSVAAALLAEAVGKQLTCVFVDHGLLRLNEAEEVRAAFAKWDINFVYVNAARRFLMWLDGVTDPEEKRKIIGREFIRVFEAEAKRIGAVDYLAQGTIYPDVIESGSGNAAVIKSHHNVGALPEHVEFREIVEPLRIRELGRKLGLPEALVSRQPFPGPGLAIRTIGKVTKNRLDILRQADFIFRDEIAKAGLEHTMDQYFAVLTDIRSVGVMGDGRTYDYTVALRSVTTSDFMTADWTRIPYDVLDRVSVRIVNEVPHINRVVYDITSKPPATIEWE